MSRAAKPFLAAAVQSAPVFLDRDATIEKACALITEAAAKGAKLVVLPETFVPAYPAWVWFLPLTRRADIASLYRELVENSLDVPGPEVERLGRAAREAGAWVAIGINERNATKSGTTLYNTLLVFNDRGELVDRHRKLMPTGGERMVWTPGEPAPLQVHDSPFGRLGGLICWENYMPLARFSLYEQGAQIHLAPTWDKSDQWLASMRHIAREGRLYVIGVCQALHRDQVPDRFPFERLFIGVADFLSAARAYDLWGSQTFVQADLAEVNQVKVIRQIVRTWSTTHKDSAPLLETSAASNTARPAAPRPIRLLSGSLATRGAQWHEQDWKELPPHRRTEQLSGTSECRTETQQEAKTTIFRHEGEYWQIVYKGDCIRIRSAKGVLYLRHLVQHPGEKIHLCDLAALADHSASVGKATESSADRGIDVPPEPPLITNDRAVIDYRETWKYRARLHEFRAELDETSQWADVGRAASIQREIDVIQKEIDSAYGISGRLRKLDQRPNARARPSQNAFAPPSFV